MNAITNDQILAEDISDGINALGEIAEHADASNAASLSRFRDAIRLIRDGVTVTSTLTFDESHAARLDEIVRYVEGDKPLAAEAKRMAMAYLLEIERLCGKVSVPKK